MNKYLKNLKKIEFVVTDACTGRCRHCSEGDHSFCGQHISGEVASEIVGRVASVYDIETVMAFGGEPLLYPDTVYGIMRAASIMKIRKRQIITNGYFSKDKDEIKGAARELLECGVNEILLSVDAFHQEYIPLDTVRYFASEVTRLGIPAYLQPAWLVSPSADNRYNKETRKILDSFFDIKIPENGGNIVFPEGNAKKYLSEYFADSVPKNPYVEDPYDMRCLSVSANGDVLGGNVYMNDILEIIEKYDPEDTEKTGEKI